MNKFFDVINKSRRGMFISAPNEKFAKKYAVIRGHISKAENGTAADLTDVMKKDSAWASLKEILEKGGCCQLSKRIDVLSFADITLGKKPGPGKWIANK